MSVDCSPEARELAESMAGDPALSWRFHAEALTKSGLAKMPFASCPVADRSAVRPDVPLYVVPAHVYHAPAPLWYTRL